MKKAFILILLLCSLRSGSQNFFTSAFAGFGNYQGDLQDNPFNPLTTKPAGGFGLLYEINHNLLLKFDLTIGKVAGDDRYSAKNRNRNLSFTSNITEFALGAEYLFFDLYYYKVSPYIFAQGAIFNFSPYYLLPNGSKIVLYEIDTEGQGFYKDRKKYNLRQFCIPFGFGVQWALNDNKRVGFVFGFRKTFTDYIDDVSTTYIDRDILEQNRGASALAIAYRGNELPNGTPYPADGTIRGNPKNKDSYYFAGITFRFRIGASREAVPKEERIRKSRLTCPVMEY